MDTKDSKEEPIKVINSQTDKEAPPNDEEFEIWHDAQQKHKLFHLTVDHQTIGHKEKGRQHQVMYTSQTVVDAMLLDLDWEELVGHHEPFNTICFRLSTIQKFQRFENLQPALAWKPSEVIKQTL